MPQPKNNLSQRRTQKLLREALIELIEEQSFDALTVQQITERAMVSRATFYRNYQDKYALVEQIYMDATQVLFDTVIESGTAHPPQIWVKFFEHIAEYDRLYRALLGRKGSPWFVLKMRTSLVDLVERLTNGPNAVDPVISPPFDGFVANLVATMLVEAITWWLEQGKPYPPQEIAWRCAQLAAAIFKESSAWP